MERDDLFKMFGFEKVGGCLNILNGVTFHKDEETYEIDAWIYIDFKRKRVMIDDGNAGDPMFLKGGLTKREEIAYNKYVAVMEYDIAVAAGINNHTEEENE